MKTIKLLMLLAVLAIVGCTQEEAFPEETNTKVAPMEELTPHMVSASDLEGIKGFNSDNLIKNNGNSSHVNIDITFPSGSSLTCSATQNNGGVHGTLVYDRNVQFIDVSTYYMDAYCVLELENGEAIVGGIITQVDSDSGSSSYEVGQTLFFKVVDNGQGINADSDQYIPTFFIGDSELPCEFANFLFNIFNFPPVDIGNNSMDMQSPDKVKVN